MSNLSFQNLSKLIFECTKALGKTLSDPAVQKTLIASAVASVSTAVIVDQIDKKQIIESQEKERLYKQALAEHEAIIKELKTNAELSKERQDYLVGLNERLLKQIEICKSEDSDE